MITAILFHTILHSWKVCGLSSPQLVLFFVTVLATSSAYIIVNKTIHREASVVLEAQLITASVNIIWNTYQPSSIGVRNFLPIARYSTMGEIIHVGDLKYQNVGHPRAWGPRIASLLYY